MLSRFQKPKLLPLILSACGVLLMFALGTWQLQRLAWKEHLLATIERAAQEAPMQTLPNDKTELEAKRFYTVQLTGDYLPEHEFHIAARYFQHQLGYSVLTPFRMEDGRVVLVNRGWVPTASKDPATRPLDISGPRTILAQIRTSNERNHFTPVNQPELNIWFGRDVQEMASHAGLTFAPVTLDLIGDQDITHLPVPSRGEIKLRNDHLGYAITWFAIGFGIIIIALVYHRKSKGDA